MYICFDLDDTILSRNKENKLSDFTLRVLNKAKEEGHVIIVNTARSFKNCVKYLDIIKPDYSILNAGSQILDKDYNLIFQKMMSFETTKGIIKELQSLGYEFSVQTEDKLLSCIPDGYGEWFDFNQPFAFQSYKIVPKNIKVDDGKMISNKFGVEFTLYLSGLWSRFNHLEASKLKGLEYVVLKVENGSMNLTISFGDDYGDLTMLLGSGIGVSVANSVEEVYNKTKYHTDSCDDDGVAKFLVNYLKLNID